MDNIPAGSMVVAPIAIIHRNSRSYHFSSMIRSGKHAMDRHDGQLPELERGGTPYTARSNFVICPAMILEWSRLQIIRATRL